MFCQKCGQPLEEGSAFCTRCGTPIAPANRPTNQQVNRPTGQPNGQPANRPAAQPSGRPPKPIAQNGMKKPKKLVLPIVAGVLVVTIVVLTVIWVLRLKDPTKDFERITFGSYEQDNKTSNGKEEIEWLVLKRDGNRALVVSRYALDCQPYNTERTDVTWETCSLREWLNNDFYNTAFSDSEKTKIIATGVVNEDNPEYGMNGGNNTSDKVFLLGDGESHTYFGSEEARRCVPTKYAKAEGAWTNSRYFIGGRATCSWWTRSSDYDFPTAVQIVYNGTAFSYDCYVDECLGVRPALWINL